MHQSLGMAAEPGIEVCSLIAMQRRYALHWFVLMHVDLISPKHIMTRSSDTLFDSMGALWNNQHSSAVTT